MIIGGMQKLTLLDYPGEMACILFTAGCDFRCPYCHNSGLLINADAVPEDEVFSYLEKRRELLDGVVITGGEPLMHEDIFDLAEKIRALGYKIKLDTNGSYPGRLLEMIESGLADYVAMDVKHLPKKYERAAGVKVDTDAIKKSIEILKDADIKREFRTTVVKGIHELDDIVGIAKMLSTDVPYYLQSYRKSEGVLSPEGLEAYSEAELRGTADASRVYCSNTSVRGV